MTRMTPSEAMVETLAAQGVTHVFGIVGSAYMDALDLFEPAGIRFISVAHEQGAGHMADGFSRASGRHGVCIAQNGPGITNFVTAVAAAYWAHSPVVVITPETGSNTQGLGGFQEAEQMPFFEKITKYQVHCGHQGRMAELLSRCFDYAMMERGPTQFNIPRDLFYGEADYAIPQPIRVERGAGGPSSLEAAAEALAGARFPVILSGGGVVMSDGVDEVVKLAEHLSAPVVNTYLHNDSFPKSHPLWVGPIGYQGSKAAMKLLAQADVVLALGTRLGPFGTLPQHGIDYWPKNAKLVQVEINPRKLGLVKQASVAVCGDARAATTAILEKLQAENRQIVAHGTREARLSEIQKQKDEWEAELNQWGQADGSPISPRRILRELEKAMPDNAMVTTDIGNICSVSNSYLRFEKPHSFFAAMSFGNCGYAYPTAIGAKVARPDRPAIAYVGDGAWGMSLQETLTAVRENIPAIAVVFNNGQWGAEKKNQIDYYADRFIGTNLKNPSFAAIADSMGAKGIKVDHPGQIGDALREAVASGRPCVLEIMATEELGDPFRRDALKKPHRLLPKYADYTVA
ncbi:MAG TPA: sulfoacetaldehyde acetyltransferase [Geminicoccus sp.]|jgi:sulfoacetaldehyde acetyltransferase|uniref:sulfoacetaldehyde acetyltransferase n=1 Tax=Geminicoccus sp. TaxID=2024832 RepID=UPI002E3585DA|nr:sulfoacetaldehyde acetyltransferase [Geminicoccus sp.]HEX2528757.1 sulfoacetaldehyde acetyltransferase [Geminicoccus sp.]